MTANVYAIAAVSMGMTPLLMKAARRLTPLLVRIPGLKMKNERMSVENLITRVSGIKDHAVICGYMAPWAEECTKAWGGTAFPASSST